MEEQVDGWLYDNYNDGTGVKQPEDDTEKKTESPHWLNQQDQTEPNIKPQDEPHALKS